MKMNFKILLFLLIVCIFPLNIYAASYSVKMTGDSSFSDTLTVYVSVSDYKDIIGSCNGICGLTTFIDYDSSKVKLESINDLAGFDTLNGTNLVLFKNTGVASGTKIFSLKFSNVSLKSGSSTTLTLKNIVASDGTSDISANNATFNIKYLTNSSSNSSSSSSSGSSSSSSSSSGSSNSYSSNSSNTTVYSYSEFLKEIVIEDLDFTFSLDVFNYELLVDNDVDNLNIFAFNVEDVVMNEDVNYELEVGVNKIELLLAVSEDESYVYTFYIQRAVDEDVDVDDDNQDEVIELITGDRETKNTSIFYVMGISILFIVMGIVFCITKINNK